MESVQLKTTENQETEPIIKDYHELWTKIWGPKNQQTFDTLTFSKIEFLEVQRLANRE